MQTFSGMCIPSLCPSPYRSLTSTGRGSEWDSTAAPHSVPRSAASTSHFLLMMFHFAFRFRESSASLLVDVSNRSGSRDPKIERDARWRRFAQTKPDGNTQTNRRTEQGRESVKLCNKTVLPVFTVRTVYTSSWWWPVFGTDCQGDLSPNWETDKILMSPLDLHIF